MHLEMYDLNPRLPPGDWTEMGSKLEAFQHSPSAASVQFDLKNLSKASDLTPMAGGEVSIKEHAMSEDTQEFSPDLDYNLRELNRHLYAPV